MQETHSIKKYEKVWKGQWGGQIIYNHGGNNARGVAVLINKKATTRMKKVSKDEEGQWLIIDVEVNGDRYTLVNIYGPNEDNVAFFQKIFEEIGCYYNENIIMGADFNTGIEARDKRGGFIPHPKTAKFLKTQLNMLNFVDTWREYHPNLFQFTWKRCKPKVIMQRMDYLMITTPLIGAVKLANILPAFQTDHSFPCIEIEKVSAENWPGYWEMNIDYLQNEDYRQHVAEIISKAVENYKDVYI